MIQRRLLLYLLVAAVLSLTATVAFTVYSLGRAIDHTLEQNLVFAQTAARFVGDLVQQEGDRLVRILDELPDDPGAVAEALAKRPVNHTSALEQGQVAIFNARRRLIAGRLVRGGVVPAKVLNPALRHARTTGERVISDLWWGRDEKPRVAIVVGRLRRGVWRAAVGQLRLDRPEFLRPFSYFLLHEPARLQLLDSAGIVLFSTQPDERYASAVHGTYFRDLIRLREPTQIECHSCHVEPGKSGPEHTVQVREPEVSTVAPVEGTEWSVTVREGTDTLYAPMREIVFSSVALVAVVFGAFVGSFLLLSRRVLRPMRQLAEAASAITQGGEDALPPEGRDEVAMLTRSFEAMRRKMLSRAPSPPPTRSGEWPLAIAQGGPSTDPQLRQAIAEALSGILEGLEAVEVVRSAILIVSGAPLGSSVLASRRIALRDPDDLGTLEALGLAHRHLTVEALGRHGVPLSGGADTRIFRVHRFKAFESLQGQLWIGVQAADERLSQFLRPAMEAVAAQVQSLMERSLLHAQLRKEHERKNRMLRHLFEAESTERKRIARELHDETAQALTALLLLLETFPTEAEQAQQLRTLDLAKERVEQILDGTDRMIRRLRPALLDDLGLVEAICALGHNVLIASGVDFDLVIEGEELPVSKAVENEVYRVFQEAATNVLRHSAASQVEACISIDELTLRASFADNGRGMDLSWLSDPEARPRWGVLGMQERVVQLGGQIEFSEPEGGGLRIEFEVPRCFEPRPEGVA